MPTPCLTNKQGNIVEAIGVWAAIAAGTSIVALLKGRNALHWLGMGAVGSIIALAVIMLMRPLPPANPQASQPGPGLRTQLLGLSGAAIAALVAVWLIFDWTEKAPSPDSYSETRPAAQITATPEESVPADPLKTATEAIANIEKRYGENKRHLEKYYATPQLLKVAINDGYRLVFITAAYKENGSSAEERSTGQRAALLLDKVTRQARLIYASSSEQLFMQAGMNIQVSAEGRDKKTLRLVYSLMSPPLVYKFQNELGIPDQARKPGFSKITYTNGFSSSLGSTWTVDL